MLAHVSERSFVDHIVVASGSQQLKKIQAALRAGRCEERKAVIADMSTKAVSGLMPGARIVNGQPGCRSKSCAQHFNIFFEESILLTAQKPHDLPLGNRDAQAGQLRGEPRDRDLTLVILAQDEALEVRPEMAADALGQRRHNGLAGGKQPALAPVADRPRLDDDILDDKVLVALEARAFRQAVWLQDTGLVNGERSPLGAAATLPPGVPSGIRRLLHAAGLELGASLQALEPRDLLAQFCVLCL